MLVVKALKFAAERHKDQSYGDGIPYVTHLASVVSILYEVGAPIIVVAAGALHDVLEDTETTIEELDREFGPWVTELVVAVTNPKEGTRKEKHEIQYPIIARVGEYAVMVKLADRLSHLLNGGKKGMYQREHETFKQYLYRSTDLKNERLWGMIDREIAK